jgi:MFS family permease
MSDVPAGVEAGQLENGEAGAAARPAGWAAYLAVLRKPGAARFCVTGMIGRAPMSMFGLGTVLLISASTGRYALAGLIAGAGSVGYAITAPQIARLADAFGQRRVLRPQIVVFAAACAAFVSCAELKTPVWVLVITGCLAGSSMPSLGSMVRARWSVLLSDAADLHTAFALESVVDEMVFVAGPPLVTVLAAELPPAGILLCAVLAVVGTLLFAAQRQTEPPVRARRPASERRSGRRFLPSPGLITMVPLCYFLGAMFASIDLSTVDFAQRQGHKPLAGLVLGTYALGSGIGGLWYGSRHWRAPVHRRFALTLLLTVAGVATFWVQPALISLDAGMLVAGLTIAPTLSAGYGLTEQQAQPDRRTEAMTWLSSSIAVGVATGSSVCGRIIDTAGPRWGYGFAACCGAVAVATCLLGLRRLAVTTEVEAAQWVDA